MPQGAIIDQLFSDLVVHLLNMFLNKKFGRDTFSRPTFPYFFPNEINQIKFSVTEHYLRTASWSFNL